MKLSFDELYEKIKKICRCFPIVEEKVDGFGHTSFRVKNKPFVILGGDEIKPSLSIKTLKTTQEMLIQQTGYKKSPYIGQHGWTTFPLENVDWKAVEDYLLEAYFRTAPKSVSKKMQMNRN